MCVFSAYRRKPSLGDPIPTVYQPGNSFSWWHEKLFGMARRTTAPAAKVIHTHQTSCRCGWPVLTSKSACPKSSDGRARRSDGEKRLKSYSGKTRGEWGENVTSPFLPLVLFFLVNFLPRSDVWTTGTSFSWIFTSVSVDSSPHSCLFTSMTDRIGVHAAPKYGTRLIRCATLHFPIRRCAASLRHRNRAEITVLVCEQNPSPVWFAWLRKSYPVWCSSHLCAGNLDYILLWLQAFLTHLSYWLRTITL